MERTYQPVASLPDIAAAFLKLRAILPAADLVRLVRSSSSRPSALLLFFPPPPSAHLSFYPAVDFFSAA